MAKTTFAALMQIPSVWLNKVFNHRHDGLDADGSAPINYAADSGAADAYAIALAPALTAHVIGMPIVFIPAHTNTGASTIAINGLAAAAIKKNGATALAAGDLIANQLVFLIWDGTNYQLITPPILNSQAPKFVSTAQTCTQNSVLTIAHGLGVTPTIFSAEIVCLTAELNWAIGDRYVGILHTDNGPVSGNSGVVVVPDATNLTVKIGGSGIAIFDKISGATSIITTANWQLYIRAWVM